MKKSLIACLVLFISFAEAAVSQTNSSPQIWKFIDSFLTAKKNLSDVLDTVMRLRKIYQEEKNYYQVARCMYYELLIKDQRSEDTLYFHNSAFIDSMLKSQDIPGALAISLEVIQGKRIIAFTRRYLRFQRYMYKSSNIPVDYASLSNQELDSIAGLYFERAKSLSKQLAPQNIEDALWLSEDPLQFLFKPGLFDIVIAQQIIGCNQMYYQGSQFYNIDLTRWLYSDQNGFIGKLDSLGSASTKNFPVLNLYAEWLNYHKADKDSYYFIETLARKYFYNRIKSIYPETEGLYENYLQTLCSSPFIAAKANAVYQLCLLWNSESAKYFPASGFRTGHSSGLTGKLEDFDTTHRYDAVRALELFEKNKAMLDSFYYLKNILLRMEERIREPEIGIKLEQNNLPDEPMLAELRFKNADTLYYRIVKTNQNFLISSENYNRSIFQLLNKPAVCIKAVSLPATNDHNYHAAYLSLDSLPVGEYFLLFSYLPVKDTSDPIQFVSFNVTNIAIINNDRRIYVLHRKTGMPLTGAAVRAVYNKETRIDSLARSATKSKYFKVNGNGFITIPNSGYHNLYIYYRGDTVSQWLNINDHNAVSDDIYTKDEYLDLVDFYEENARAYIYTDRSIYRPGQTIYFKAIFITKDRKTGEPLVMSKHNLKGKLFANVYKKWLREEEPWLFLNDPFNKEIDSIKIKPNDYGSVSGSFTIPKTAATGEWNIEPDYIDADYNTGTFKIEEYKRPSYEIKLEKPGKELLPGDKFSIRVKVRSFAGADLNNVKLNYSVTREGNLPESAGSKNEKEGEQIDVSIRLADTTVFTNEQGEYEIPVNDSLLKGYKLNEDKTWNFYYQIKAEAIDPSGESYEETSTVTISSRPLIITLPFSSKYNREDLKPVLIKTEDKNAGEVSKNVEIRIYKIEKDKKLFNDRDLTKTDTWLYNKEDLQQKFPNLDILKEEDEEKRALVLTDTIQTVTMPKLILETKIFTAGEYEVEAICRENGKLIGKTQKSFSVYGGKENRLPGPAWSFYHTPYSSALRGDTIEYYYGNTEKETYSVFHIMYNTHDKRKEIKYSYEEEKGTIGINKHLIRIPDDAVERLKVTQLYIFNNQLFIHEETIYIKSKAKSQPEIIVEKYRKQLSPGGKETFTVSIKTKNENTAAELMTTMYDASLDKLEEHKWDIPRLEGRSPYLGTDWQRSINSFSSEYTNVGFFIYRYRIKGEENKPLWWINPPEYSYQNLSIGFGFYGNQINASSNFSYDMNPDISSGVLAGRVPGITIANADGLNDVVVVGFGTTKRDLAGSVTSVQIRGMSDFSEYKIPMVIIDGVPYTGDINNISTDSITYAMVLKGADATAIYGTRAAEGVLLLSTKGEIVLPKTPEPQIIPRKNFSETAFFLPEIHADEDGYYSFTFTMPESVTEWNWKMLAHTPFASFAYAERKIYTSLPLMVQPDMPRVLNQGDRLVLTSRISNLDSTSASGIISCKAEDGITGEDLTSVVVEENQHLFTVNIKSNVYSDFIINVPGEQLNPLKITVTVRSENFADGEEHIIPILSNRIFVRNSKPFFIVNNSDTLLHLPTLPKDAIFFGIGVGIQPKPESALLNSLPYLADYPFECAEQIFNKLLAHETALQFMRKDSIARLSFKKAKEFISSDNPQNGPLPDELSEETMPWLNMKDNTARQQKQLFDLLDTSRTIEAINICQDKLLKLQNPDGGLTWFRGGKSNFYISCYVLRGLGQLEKDGKLLPEKSFGNDYRSFLKKLLAFCDSRFEQEQDQKYSHDVPYYIYSRSYWVKVFPVTDSMKERIESRLKTEWRHANVSSLYNQALLILASVAFSEKDDSLYLVAQKQLQSIKQLAIEDEQHGLRWKDLADRDDLTNSAEETITLLAEAFEAIGQNINKGIITWLLSAKSEHHWQSTKATSAAITLLNKSPNQESATGALNAKVGDSNITATSDLLGGSLFKFVQTSPAPESILISKKESTPVKGNFNWYYFSSLEELSNVNREVQLEKSFYKWNNAENKWQKFSGEEVLKVADKLKVVIIIQSPRALPYVYIKDSRAAAFEPVENSSRYDYSEGFSYYRSVRDDGFQFFADFIPSGRHEIEYELKVAKKGSFTNGPTELQCMYKPEISAYSNSAKINSSD